MPNTGKFLENDRHLLPLLKWYLQHVDENIASVTQLDDRDYEYIKNPDGTVTGIRPDVVCGGQAGGHNLAEGYWRAFAQSLARDSEMPEKIRVISFINHSNVHWTCSVSEFLLDPIFYQQLKDVLHQKYSQTEIAALRTIDLQNFINAYLKSKVLNIDIIHNQKIKGVTDVFIHHYDSHNPKNDQGRYYLDYLKTLKGFVAENRDGGPSILIDSKDCKRQVGNTCGDSTLYNGYTAGILGLDPGLKENQIASEALRAFAEDHVSVLTSSPKDKPQAQSVVQFIAKVTNKAKQLEVDRIHVLSTEAVISSPAVLKNPSQPMTHSSEWLKAEPVHYQYDETTNSSAKKTRKRVLSEPLLTTLNAHIQSVEGTQPSTPINKAFVSAYMQKLKAVYPEKKWACAELSENRCEFSEKKEDGTSFILEHIMDGIKLEGENRAIDEMVKAIKELDILTSEEDELVFDVIVESKEEALKACQKLFASGIKEAQLENVQIVGKVLNSEERKAFLLEVDNIFASHHKHFKHS
ncbi:hypothetical protein CC99x_008490 [Candidatus Berkiella cookevillensis]|uniref:Uncharacterized protein n=1 Tax=Candidatus Berkiella cookevillensis TaxID=437022 RepID=A0A0Q9YFG5_9GAMM|nr:hypothetical protein [Candidatus Berkiella cookevillensis]MCS5708937.1 hypothetical protein [Candidatus Berkiella cookevillensis]